jgi:uncharacterized protein
MIAATLVLGLIIGTVVGGLGGGGGVLTIPVLVYVLGQSAQDATTGSVVIVGVTALAGLAARARRGGIDWRTGFAFGVAGVPAAYVGTLLNQHVSHQALMLAFAVLAVVAAAGMFVDAWRRRCTLADGSAAPAPPAAVDGTSRPSAVRTLTRPAPTEAHRRLSRIVRVVVCGAGVGFVTGFLGVGGGFLVVPALVVVLGTPMVGAVGTSLLILVVNAAASVGARLGDINLDWRVIVPFTVAAVVGTLAGKRLADRFSGLALTVGFAAVLVVVGLGVAAESLMSF